jgi:hypothetical protein
MKRDRSVWGRGLPIEPLVLSHSTFTGAGLLANPQYDRIFAANCLRCNGS